MKILLVYPNCPETFWSFSYAVKFISKKASLPPLGLLTVAAMLPVEWEKRLVDMNVNTLKDEDLLWCDYVFLSAMSVQRESVKIVIDRCKALGIKVVAGGPLFTAFCEEFEEVDHLVLNEAEITLPLFLDDLNKGRAKHLYTSHQFADVRMTPIPLWELIDLKQYATMNIQYSRGCPFDCEFCDIPVLYGRISRTKEKEQVLAELDSLLAKGWRDGVFLVDDNFIGNKGKLKKEIVPAIINWMERKKHPFSLFTETSINLSDDEELMRMMVRAGFDTVFIGIESPNKGSLVECGKIPNKKRDLMACVKKMHRFGLQVQGGFILGFDNDPPSIFEMTTRFIHDSAIVTAMVGLLNAPPNTRLYWRLLNEGRILNRISGDNTDFSINFTPRMSYEKLITGYRSVLDSIYSPKQYYARVKRFLKDYQPMQTKAFHFRFYKLKALYKSATQLGIIGEERTYYWGLFFWCLFNRPKLFPLAITFTIYGFHFRKVLDKHLASTR